MDAGIKTSKAQAVSKDKQYVPNLVSYGVGGGGTIGMQLGWILVGATYDHQMVFQFTAPKTVNNVNLTGKQSIVGAGLGLGFGRISVFFSKDLRGEHKVNRNNISGDLVTFNEISGFRARLKYLYSEYFFISFDYEEHTFHAQKTNDVISTLNSHSLSFKGYGINFGVSI